MDQVSVIGPLHFQMIRWLILAALCRSIVTSLNVGEPIVAGGWNRFDTLVGSFAVVDAINYIVLWDGSVEAIINRSGAVFTALGTYILMRSMMRNESDLYLAIKVFACLCAITSVLMACEQITGSNPYNFLGGERAFERASIMVREGAVRRPRAMGCFQHPLTAGTFGAIVVPFFAALWVRVPKSRLMAIVGALSATGIVLASASSTPLLAYSCGIFALAMWRIRTHMRILRWTVAGTLILLQFVMKAPVWALIQRVDLIGGSSGFHRYYLVDQFIRNVGDWWLFGARSSAEWGPDMWDHANQYVAVGTTSGIIPLALFLAVIVCGFKCIGERRTEWSQEPSCAFFVWSLGAGLFANVVSFFGISYFDQVSVAWWCLLAMISRVSALEFTRERTAPAHATAVSVA
jgi:hypothetical protein